MNKTSLLCLFFVVASLNATQEWCGEYDCECECVKNKLVRIALDYNFAFRGFNKCGAHTDLAQVIFNDCFTLQDISLFLKLSNFNHVHRCPVPSTENPLDRCTRPNPQPGVVTRNLGYYRDDLYTTMLAPVRVITDAEQRETEANITWIYQFEKCIGTWDIEGYAGINIPLQSRLHLLDMQLIDGKLQRVVYNQTGAQNESTLNFFFREYTGLWDFFIHGILAPKCLTYEPRQRITGFGDISLFGMVECGQNVECVDLLQVGINLVCPSGGKLKSDKIWQVYLGNGGAFQFDAFANISFNIGSQYWNPTVRAAIEVSAPFTACFRVPQCKTTDAQLQAQDIDNLLIPDPDLFGDYWVMPYKMIDSCIPWFADESLPTRIKWGTKWLVGVGNYFYSRCIPALRFGFFYDYSGKTKDEYKRRCYDRKFYPQVLESYTEERAHRLGWSLAYNCDEWIQLSVGSEHIIAGKNVAQIHDIFATLVVVF